MTRTYRNDFSSPLALRRPRTYSSNRNRLDNKDCLEMGMEYRPRYSRKLPTAWDDITVSGYTEWYYTQEYKRYLSENKDV